jgi:hypothetical protein
VAERFKAPVLKTGEGVSSPWVRIPPLPPDAFFGINKLKLAEVAIKKKTFEIKDLEVPLGRV